MWFLNRKPEEEPSNDNEEVPISLSNSTSTVSIEEEILSKVRPSSTLQQDMTPNNDDGHLAPITTTQIGEVSLNSGTISVGGSTEFATANIGVEAVSRRSTQPSENILDIVTPEANVSYISDSHNTHVTRHRKQNHPIVTESDIKYGFLDDFEGCTLDEYKSFDLGLAAGANSNDRELLDKGNVAASGSFWYTLFYAFNGEGKHRSKLQKFKSLQLLPTWIPSYHWKYVSGFASLCICIFILGGTFLYFTSNDVPQLELDYTLCSEFAGEKLSPFPHDKYHFSKNELVSHSQYFGTLGSTLKSAISWFRTKDNNRFIKAWSYDKQNSICNIVFKVPADLPPGVFMYIGLSEVYQNHRLYLYSKDNAQLKGHEIKSANELGKYCGFLQHANCDEASRSSWMGGHNQSSVNIDCIKPLEHRDMVIKEARPGALYYPCGLIANSMFTDEISNLSCINKTYANSLNLGIDEEDFGNCTLYSEFEFSEKNIAWEDDATDYSEGNIAETEEWAMKLTDDEIRTTLIPPPHWRLSNVLGNKYINGYNRTNLPDLRNWERLRIWMRPAGMPRFRKLWGRNDEDILEKGIYSVSILDNYPVKRFNGTKSIVYSRAGPTGSRGSYAGIAYLSTGLGAIIILAFSVFVHPRKKGDLTELSWNKNPHQDDVLSKEPSTDSFLYNFYSGDEDAIYPEDDSLTYSSFSDKDKSLITDKK